MLDLCPLPAAILTILTKSDKSTNIKIFYITSKGNIGLNLPNFAATKVKFEYFFYNLTLKKLLDLDLFSCPNSYFMSSTMWWYSVKICQYSISQDIWEDIHRFFTSTPKTRCTFFVITFIKVHVGSLIERFQ